MTATFQLTNAGDSLYQFNLVDEKGEILLFGGDHASVESAQQAIAEVRTGSLMGHLIAAAKVPSGDTFFVIKSAAGEILAKSALFNSQMAFDNALHQVKDHACIAEIADLT